MKFGHLIDQPGPDRVERLLHSCEAYYRAGDNDIAVLLLREIEKELLKLPPMPLLAQDGMTEQIPQISPPAEEPVA